MPYKYCLDPHKFEDGERVRFLGKIENIDKISGVFVLNNKITKVSCIPKDIEMARDLKVGDIIRVFGRIIKMSEEAEIDVHLIQKLNVDLDMYNKVLKKVIKE